MVPTRSADVDLDVAGLTEWLGDRLPGAGEPFEVERIGQDVGIANALFALRRGGTVVVLRRPPAVKNAPSASDMAREWRILTALEGTPVPHPAPLLYCDDADVIGVPFLVMAYVDGFTPVGDLPPTYADPSARHALGIAIVDAIADLAEVDWRARGLEGFGKPDGFLERQVSRWMGQLETYRTRDIPELAGVASWLQDNRPSVQQRPGLLHGDYSPFNVMARHEPTDRLAAVVDWDSATVGDPVLDLGHLLARWTEPGEEPVLLLTSSDRTGWPTRRELAARYAERTGRDLAALQYYQALSLFKLGLILEGGVARARRAGDVADAEDAAARVDRLIHYAGVFARGERT